MIQFSISTGFVCAQLNVKTVKLATLVEGDTKALFSLATTPREGATQFSGLLHFTLDP